MGRPLKVWRRAGHSGIDHTAAGPSCRGLGEGRGGGGGGEWVSGGKGGVGGCIGGLAGFTVVIP